MKTTQTIEKPLDRPARIYHKHQRLLHAVRGLEDAYASKRSSSINHTSKSPRTIARACRTAPAAAREFVDEIGVPLTAEIICEASECDHSPIVKIKDAVSIQFGCVLIKGTKGEATPSDERFGFVVQLLNEWSTFRKYGVHAVVRFDNGEEQTVLLKSSRLT